MASRTYVSATALSRTTSTSTDYSEVKLSQQITPTANSVTLLLWSVVVDSSSASLNCLGRLRNTTDSVTLSESSIGPWSTTAKIFIGGIALHTDSGAGTAKTFEIQVASAAGTQTLGAQEATFLALELTANDQYASSTGNSTVSSTTPTTKVSMTFTPGSAGDYLFIGAMQCQSTVGTIKARLYDGTTAVGDAGQILWNAQTDWTPYCQMMRNINISGSNTLSLQFYSSGATLVTCRQAYVVALRCDDFDSHFWAEDRTTRTSTTTSYVNSASVSGVPAAKIYAVLGCGATSTSDAATTTQTGQKLNVAGTDIGSLFLKPAGWTAYWWPWMQFRVRTETAVTTTWVTQYNRVTGTGTAQSDEHVIAAIQLEATASEVTITTTGLVSPAAYGRPPIICPIGFWTIPRKWVL